MEQTEDGETCNPDFFSTSLEQYQKYRSYLPTATYAQLWSKLIVNEWHRKQNPTFEVHVKIKEDTSTVKVKITIRDEQMNSKGGTSFKINFLSENFIVSYSIRDYFNSTYDGCYSVPKYCFTLKIRLLFVSYAAYFDIPPCPLLDEVY